MRTVACACLLALFGTSCATLPGDCSAGQTLVWDGGGWACADPATAVRPHTHRVTEIRSSCEEGQVVAWSEEAGGWTCSDPADHEHAGDELGVFPPTFYYADVPAGDAEDVQAQEIEGHRFCALSEARTGSAGRCEVVLTTDGFSLQAWASPRTRTECAAVCF